MARTKIKMQSKLKNQYPPWVFLRFGLFNLFGSCFLNFGS